MMTESNLIGVLIIEDEEPARALLKHYLKKHTNLTLLGECGDGFCGLKMIKELNPDLLLLDVQMPKLSGFELLEVLDSLPHIIFTTAYDDYAIKAFDMNAIDYLLKPFSQERFDEAIKKAAEKIKEGSEKSELESLKSFSPDGSPEIIRIVVRKGNAISFIAVDEINYILAEDDYVMIWHKEGKALKNKTMKYYESHLPENDFARIHRSALVKISRLEKIEPYGKETYRAVLKDGTSLPVSRSGYQTLKEKIQF